MIEYQLTLKHWLVLALLAIAVIIATIQPLEFSAYLLHQIGTVLMLIVLFICLKKLDSAFIVFAFIIYSY